MQRAPRSMQLVSRPLHRASRLMHGVLCALQRVSWLVVAVSIAARIVHPAQCMTSRAPRIPFPPDLLAWARSYILHETKVPGGLRHQALASGVPTCGLVLAIDQLRVLPSPALRRMESKTTQPEWHRGGNRRRFFRGRSRPGNMGYGGASGMSRPLKFSARDCICTCICN